VRKISRVLAGLVVLAATIGGVGSPSPAQPVSDQSFGAYGSGATVGLNAVQLGTTQVANVQAAFAGQAVSSDGLTSPIVNELGFAVQPPLDGDNAFGRGTGLEVGLVTPTPGIPDPNQILLAGLAEATAPPPSGLVTRQIGPVPLDPIAFANLLRGQAQATFDPRTCVVGQPLAFGQGEAANLQLLNTGGTGPNGELLAPVLGASLDPDRNVSQTRAYSYLAANGDGTFAVVSEVRQTVAPINLLDGAITVELLGEWALRAIATGQPGGSRVEYAPVGAGPTTNVAVITIAGVPTTITLQQLLGPGGLVIDLAPLLTLRIGAPARAIGSTGPTPLAADGTSAQGAVDVVQLSVLDAPGLSGLDLRVGHMEAAARAPSGGVRCEIPVSKSADPDPVQVVNGSGETTVTISVPDPAADFDALFACDLIGIRIDDAHRVLEGNLDVRVISASNGGQVSADGKTVVWENLGNRARGAPPLQVSVRVRITGTTAGRVEDTARVTATLGNCQGGAAGQDLVGQASLDGQAISGEVTFRGPEVGGPVKRARDSLSRTGNDPLLPLAGGALLLAGLGVRRRLVQRLPRS